MGATNNKPLRHVTLFKFKDGTSAEDIAQIVQDFHTVATKIPEVKQFEWGTNVSPEKFDRGNTHCFLLTFANEKDRDIYIDNEDRTAFAKKLLPLLDAATVVDYWASSN